MQVKFASCIKCLPSKKTYSSGLAQRLWLYNQSRLELDSIPNKRHWTWLENVTNDGCIDIIRTYNSLYDTEKIGMRARHQTVDGN